MAGSPIESGVTLAVGQVNLSQDFGYRDTSSPNSISGILWQDTNANGMLEASEPVRFAGVTVGLYNASGNLVATAVTDGSGGYNFANLPDGTFRVDVTDEANLLDGYWHSPRTERRRWPYRQQQPG